MSEKQAKIAFLAIGSNLGNRKLNIELTKFKLQSNLINILKSSSLYETSSWPDKTKPKFLNNVIKIKTYLSPAQLLKICKKIEFQLGRKRKAKNEPRTCDIDIIDYDQKAVKSINSYSIVIPHPRMESRNFVLIPLYELSKNWKHPIKKVNIVKLISFLDAKDLTSIKQI